MKTFFNFKTKQVINPLEKINYFFSSPYMPDNMRLLNLAEKLEGLDSVITSVDDKGHVITLFPIDLLVSGDVMIDWRSEDSFCINGKIWCKIVGKEKDIVRVDTVRF